MRDTIFALSSGALPAAIGVVRVSGPRAFEAARALTAIDLPPARTAGLRKLRDPLTGDLLDEALLLCFTGDRSETGEDMVELQCHGSRAVVRGVEAALGSMPGLRLAEPGEFTRRAFLNGRMDLAGIEGLGDLLAAETVLQRRAAMAMMGGGLSRRIAHWTKALRQMAAQVEAHLDFSDEGDVAPAELKDIIGYNHLQGLADELAAEMRRSEAERLRDGIRIAIGGPPNAGKSTLFNALLGRDAAIVSPHAGTTRDVIEATVSLRGVPMVIADSAGLRDAEDEVERIGVDRAAALLAGTDIVLWLGDENAQPEVAGTLIQVLAKADLADRATEGLAISAMTGAGMEELIDRLCDAAAPLLPVPGDYALSRRQRSVLQRVQAAVDEALIVNDEILLGECLRQALVALDELTGKATTEAVLDELFSGFCIGK